MLDVTAAIPCFCMREILRFLSKLALGSLNRLKLAKGLTDGHAHFGGGQQILPTSFLEDCRDGLIRIGYSFEYVDRMCP